MSRPFRSASSGILRKRLLPRSHRYQANYLVESNLKMVHYCGTDLHADKGAYVIIDENHHKLFSKRLPNSPSTALNALESLWDDHETVAVESAYNWHWLVYGLLGHGYGVQLANPCAVKHYDGRKHQEDHADGAFLVRLASLRILPIGCTSPKSGRSVRDLLRRNMLRRSDPEPVEPVLSSPWKYTPRLERYSDRLLVSKDAFDTSSSEASSDSARLILPRGNSKGDD